MIVILSGVAGAGKDTIKKERNGIYDSKTNS